MKNMKLSPTEKKDMGAMSCCDTPEYPYGLKLDLCGEVLDKLGIKELPEIGTKFQINALAEVCSTNKSEYEDKTHLNLGLQITDLEIVPLSLPKTAAQQLYGEDMED